jgi:CRP/FNR family transcriptional regulator
MIHPSSCFLCKHSLPEWAGAIATNAEVIQFKKGQVLFREGDPASGFFFIHEGKVKVHKQWGDEKDLIIKIAAEGDVLGHRGIGPRQSYPVTATALDQGSACFITTAFFRTTLKVNSELSYQMMMLYAHELQAAEHNMRNMVHMDVKGRIAEALLKMKEIFGLDEAGHINSSMTKQDIASYAGTTYETLFKVLNEWAQDGVLEVSGKSILVRKEKKLRAYIRHS